MESKRYTGEYAKQDTIEMHTRDTIEVLSLDEVSGMSLDQLAEAAIHKMTIVDKPSKFMRRELGISDSTSYEEGVRERVMRDLTEYKQTIESVKVRAHKQAEYCQQYAVEHQYLDQNRPVRIVVSSRYLGRGNPSIGVAQQYDAAKKHAVIQFQDTNSLIAHEVGHMLSHDRETNQVGFGMYTEGAREQKIRCLFLNEGTTVMWEQDTVTDGSRNLQHDDPLDLYRWYRDTTLSLLREVGMTKDDLYRAYFGQPEAKQKLDEAIEQRFHCSMDDLNVLSFSLRQAETDVVLRGEPFKIQVSERTHESVVRNLEKLNRIFPNVSLVRPPLNE